MQEVMCEIIIWIIIQGQIGHTHNLDSQSFIAYDIF